MLFAVKYGVTIMRALRTSLVAAPMATTAWTSTHAFERVDLIGGAGAFVAVAGNDLINVRFGPPCGFKSNISRVREVPEPVMSQLHDGRIR